MATVTTIYIDDLHFFQIGLKDLTCKGGCDAADFTSIEVVTPALKVSVILAETVSTREYCVLVKQSPVVRRKHAVVDMMGLPTVGCPIGVTTGGRDL